MTRPRIVAAYDGLEGSILRIYRRGSCHRIVCIDRNGTEWVSRTTRRSLRLLRENVELRGWMKRR